MNMRKQSSAIRLLYPWTTMTTFDNEEKKRITPGGKLALSKDPETNLMLWNTLGVASWAVPSAAIAAYLVNRNAMRKVKKDRDITGKSKLDSRRIGIGTSLGEPTVEEGDLILKKDASAGLGLFRSAVPVIAAPALLWLTSDLVNKEMKDKYAKELDEENAALQREQDEVDLAILEAKGYLKRKKQDWAKQLSAVKTDSEPLPKAASASGTFGGPSLKGGWGFLRDAGGTIYASLPATLMGLSAVTLSALGAAYFLKRHEDVRKIKMLKDRMLGEDRLLETPKLRIEIPEHLEESDKVTQQIIPGIEASEPTVVVEEPEKLEKKDAFL